MIQTSNKKFEKTVKKIIYDIIILSAKIVVKKNHLTKFDKRIRTGFIFPVLIFMLLDELFYKYFLMIHLEIAYIFE